MTNLDGAAASIDAAAAQSAVDQEAAAVTAYGVETPAELQARQIIEAKLGYRWNWPIRATIEIHPYAESIHLARRPVHEIIDVQDSDGNDLEWTLESGFIVKLVGENREAGTVYKSPDHFDLDLMASYEASPSGPYIPQLRHKFVYVTYTYGSQPPQAIQRAMDVLAVEIQKAIDGDNTCKLPSRVTSATRQGITFTLLDPQTFLDEGKTGIYEVDLALITYNPSGAKQRARVWGPAHRPARRSNPLSTAPGRTASDYDLVIQAGANYLRDFFYLEPDEVTPVDLTGYTARMQIRRAASSDAELLLDVYPEVTVVSGRIRLSLDAVQTGLLTAQSYVYAIELSTSPTNVIRLIGGRVWVSPEVVF
jgi:hypothetical protein